MALAVVLLLGGPGALPAVAGDVDVAKVLLESAREQVKKRKPDEALALLDKALAEDPRCLGALFLKGAMHEQRKESGPALAAYRKYLEVYADRSAKNELAKEDEKDRAQVAKRIDALAAGDKELKRIEDEFAADLVALAKKYAADNPDVSRKALEIVLSIRPDHAEAAALLASLGGEAPAPAAAGGAAGPGASLFKQYKVRSEVDLLATKALGNPDEIKYGEDGRMTVTTSEKGSLMQTVDPVATGPSYVIEGEFELVQTNASDWLTGVVFAIHGGGITHFHSAFVQSGRVLLHHVDQPLNVREDVAGREIAAVTAGSMHRLGVVVQEKRIEVFVDGKRILNYSAPRTEELAGDVGLWQQGCVTRYRSLRLGRLE